MTSIEPTTAVAVAAAAAVSASTDTSNGGGNNNLSSSSAMAESSSAGGGAAKGSLTEQNISYSAERIIGNGSFGVVFEAKVVETGEVVAIKKVLQDKRFKNRELQIMRQLVKDPHPNIVALKHCFYSQVCAGLIEFVLVSLQYIHTNTAHFISNLFILFFVSISGRETGRIISQFSA